MSDAPVTVVVQHATPLRRWHRLLAERLSAAGHAVGLRAVPQDHRRQHVDRLLAVERRLYGASSAFDAPIGGAPLVSGSPDLVVVLAGDLPSIGRAIRPFFDGRTGQEGLLAALLAGRAPVVTVRSDDGRVLAAGHPAVEDPQVLARALDDVLPRLVTLLAQAVEVGSDVAPAAPAGHEDAARTGRAIRLLASGISRRLRRRLLGGNDCRWQLATRLVDGTDLAEDAGWSAPDFHPVPVPADRLHADPFVFAHGGRTHIFFEEMPFATGKGVIARLEIDARGRPSAPRPVLELPCHLSYPFLLRHGGGIFMLPETSAARRLALYRAKPFPDRWIEERVLLDATSVSDATPILHDGRWWLFATQNDDGGSSWDQLALFHAPDLLGPWTPHRANPVLIDAGAARPAGAMWHDADGALMRVAQDCRRGYGAGLAVCRVERLDADGFAQSVVARLGPPPGSDALGVHTLSRAGPIEAIDLRQP